MSIEHLRDLALNELAPTADYAICLDRDLRQQMIIIMRQINEEDGVSMLLVEQNATLALGLAHHAYLLETGRVALSGPSEQIKNDESVRRAYLGY